MENKKIHLKNRKVLKVSGENSIEFLNNILTSDITKLKPKELLPSALLSPQGRILFDILVSTIIAVVLEIKLMFVNTSVTLADLLLMFLYLEVLAMVRVFWDQQSISITLPLLIAITALSRFIILQGKEMDPSALVYEAVAIVLIAGAIVILRLRHSDKLGISKKKKSK